MVEHVGVLDLNKIKPAASSSSPRAYTPFTSDLLEVRADSAGILCRKGTGANPGSVRLDCANDVSKLARVESETDNNSSQACVKKEIV